MVVEASPALLVSAGLAGAVSPNLKSGEVLYAREVMDEAASERCAGGRPETESVALGGGNRGKQDLAVRYRRQRLIWKRRGS